MMASERNNQTLVSLRGPRRPPAPGRVRKGLRRGYGGLERR